MVAIARVSPTLPVVDMQRAREFYEGRLGLKVLAATRGGVVYECGDGTRLLIYPRATPTKADNPAASFEVADVESEVRELRGKGVIFEEYDLPGLKTVNGIATIDGRKAAWFKDTEGNVLALTQLAVEPSAYPAGLVRPGVAVDCVWS